MKKKKRELTDLEKAVLRARKPIRSRTGTVIRQNKRKELSKKWCRRQK